MAEEIPTFAKLPPVMGAAEVQEIGRQLDELTSSRGDSQQVAQLAHKLAIAYAALLTHVQLAELAMHRLRQAAEDERNVIEKETGRSLKVNPMHAVVVMEKAIEHYVDPVQPGLREALGIPPEGPVDGYYMALEGERAKLVGSKRAQERLSREGFPTSADYRAAAQRGLVRGDE